MDDFHHLWEIQNSLKLAQEKIECIEKYADQIHKIEKQIQEMLACLKKASCDFQTSLNHLQE